MTDETTKVTERDPVQEDLLVSEIRYRRLFESARDGILILDAVSRKITDANPFMVELLGYSREEFRGKELWQLGLFQDVEESKAAFRELQEQGYIRYDNLPLEPRTGKRREVEFISNVYREGDRQVIQCNIRDNTEHKRVKEESEHTSEWLLAIFEASQDGIVVEENEQIVFVNNRFLRMYGYDTPEEVLGGHALRPLKAEDAERVAEYGRKRLRGEAAPTIYEFTGINKDGREMPLEASISTFTSNGKFYIVAALRDITERKRLENELRRSEASLANAQRIAHIGSWDWDIQNNLLFWSEEVYQIFDIAKTQFGANYESFLSAIHPEDRQLVQSAVDAALAQVAPYNIEHRIITQAGVERVVCELGEVTFDEWGKPLRMTGTAQDITGRKRDEATLRESEDRYRLLFKSNPLPVWVYDLETLRFLAVNDAAILHYGYSREEFLAMTIMDIRPPEDIPALLDNVSNVSGGIDAAGEWKHRKKDGQIIDVELTSHELIFAGRPAEIVLANDLTNRKLTEDALRQAEAKYRSILESVPAIVYLAQPFPPYSTIYVSPNIKEFGYSEVEWSGRDDMWVSVLHAEDRERVLRATENAISQGLETELEYRIIGPDGAIHWVHDKGRFILDEQGNKTCWQGVMLDVTKTKELEEQLRQSQKLESVGRLAGGIAHDFNNMLTAINGYSQLTLRRLEPDDPLRHNIEEIMKAGARSAALTHQLLAFSRQQLLQPVVLDLNEVITDTIIMLQRLIGEDVQLVTALNPKSGRVKVDPGQLSQIIMNLAVNARDAMPQGGQFTIETANVFLDPDYASQHVGVLPGAYVMLSVSDTGTGMSANTQQHIFEPFFTTKEVGKGTGLGLATVYGIVKQSGGNIQLYSEEGVGTTFKVYLPRVADQPTEAATEDSYDELLGGTETILLVEDEEMVRTLTRHVLEECGYTVLEAGNGVEALSMCEKHDCQLDLLMTDVVMPQMGGRELAERFADKYPQMPILFTSGYTDDAVVRHGVIEAGTNFIQKPFTPQGLAHKVREILDAPPQHA